MTARQQRASARAVENAREMARRRTARRRAEPLGPLLSRSGGAPVC
ncbi:hypothetical protein [Streptomyces odonnellii]